MSWSITIQEGAAKKGAIHPQSSIAQAWTGIIGLDILIISRAALQLSVI